MKDMDKDNEFYFISVKHPTLPLSSNFEEYLATNDDFRNYCGEVFDLDPKTEYDAIALRRVLRAKKRVEFIQETYFEDRTMEGFRRIVKTQSGNVKIGFTRVREHRIYVKVGDVYLRGYKVFLADLCLDNAWGFEPLNRLDNNGNIEILEYNKRPCRKGIKYINNKLQNILFIIDMVFETRRQMENDIKSPKPLNLEGFIASLLK